MPQRMSRRGFLTSSIGVGMLAGTGALTACGSGSSVTKQPLTLVTWGGTTQEGIEKALTKPFTKETGIAVKVTAPVDYGKFAAQVKSKHVLWDWIDAESWFPYAEPDLLAALDFDALKVDEADMIKVGDNPPITKWGVASGSYSFAISYRTDHDGKHPRNWEEFFDTKAVPGKRGVYNWPFGMLEAALLGDGVPFEKLYPLDIDRAFKRLDTIRDDLVFWNSGAELQQQLSSGAVPFAYAWNNRVAHLAKNGTPVAIEWNENIQDGGWDILPKNNPQNKEITQYLAFTNSPDRQYAYSKYTGYSPASKKAMARMKPDEARWYNAYGPNQEKAAGAINPKWWGENMDAVSEKWSQWAGK